MDKMPRTIRHNDSPRGFRSVHSSSTPDMSIVKSEFTPSPHLLDHGYGATPISQVMSSSIPAQAPPVKRKLNMESQHFVTPSVVPITQEFKPPQPKKQKRPTPVKKNTRYDTSLSLLTKKFSDLLEKSPHGVVDLNKASQELKVQKRRIYDITNVLEGIGILEKKSKNNIQWKGARGESKKYLALKKQMKNLENLEISLDRMISSAESELRKLSNHRYGYVTYQDLRSIDKFKHKTVMAIKAPPHTQLSVPSEGQETGRYNIQMKSESGEIDVFLCPENVPPVKPKSIPPMDPLLRDIKLSPGLFDITTPPVPQLDSPVPPVLQSKPISSQICRSLFFTKDSYESGPSTSQSQNEIQSDQSRTSSQYNNTPNSNSLQQSAMSNSLDFHLSPINMGLATSNGNSHGIGLPLIHLDEAPSPMVGRFNFSQQTEHSLGTMDPLFSSELVPLEPLMQPEYNFSLDANEGLADLFDYDFLTC